MYMLGNITNSKITWTVMCDPDAIDAARCPGTSSDTFTDGVTASLGL